VPRSDQYWGPGGGLVSETSLNGRRCENCGKPAIMFYCDPCYRAGQRNVHRLQAYRDYEANFHRRIRGLIATRGW
jgi:hypothetical protein